MEKNTLRQRGFCDFGLSLQRIARILKQGCYANIYTIAADSCYFVD